MDALIGFIGGGNMAAALIGGSLARGAAAGQFIVVEPNPAAGARLAERFGIRVLGAANTSLADCEAIVLAVKPQNAKTALTSLTPFCASPFIVSIAAGIRTAELARWLPAASIVRCMPNTPALIGEGITALYAGKELSTDQRTLAETLMAAVGKTLWVDDEQLLDAVTALSGSGPAYAFYVLESMQQAGVELGLSPADARTLAIQTLIGAGRLAADSDEALGTLRERVTSKGGTTFAALNSLQKDAVGEAIVRAIHAAAARSVELGDEAARED